MRRQAFVFILPGTYRYPRRAEIYSRARPPLQLWSPSPHFVHSSDSEFAHKLLKLAANDITGIRRESSAHGIEFLLRAGSLRFAVHGLERSEWVLERLAPRLSYR